jgi:hypothetical protein
MLANLLSESLVTDFETSWERERMAIPVRVFAIQFHATSYSLKKKRYSAYSAFNALIKQLGTEYIGWLTAATTSLRRS